MKTRVISIDAWRAQDGWTWNQWHQVAECVEIPNGVSNRGLIKIAREDLSLLNDASKGKVAVEDDGYSLLVVARNTGQPLYAFCYGEYQ